MKLKNVLRVAKRVFVKRKYKDILFRFVFREPRELLELYNAMNHTDYTNPEDLIITTMEDVVYMGMKNDLSFLVANELNLYEHQSTLNHNMLLRGLLYLAKMYEEALREEGRDEMVEKCQKMSKTIEEITKVNEEIIKEKEEIAKEKDALLKKHIESQRIQAEHLKAKGFSYEEAKEIMVGFGEEELERIYGE